MIKAESKFILWMKIYTKLKSFNLKMQKVHDAAMDAIGLNSRKENKC